jgi:histone H3/H4
VEQRAPSHEPPAPQSNPKESTVTQSSNPNDEILVVVSKLKAYIKTKADMNTSGEVLDYLSDKLRALCDQAIQKARADGRKTVMARDFV